jgi:hypothetical protein
MHRWMLPNRPGRPQPPFADVRMPVAFAIACSIAQHTAFGTCYRRRRISVAAVWLRIAVICSLSSQLPAALFVAAVAGCP